MLAVLGEKIYEIHMADAERRHIVSAKIEAVSGMAAYGIGSFVVFASGAVEAGRQISREIAFQRPVSAKELIIGGVIVAASGVATYLHGSNRLAQFEAESY